MRLETREPDGSDVRAQVDPEPEAGEVRRSDTELRVGAPDLPGADGLRSAAAHAARALRRSGGTVAWAAANTDQVRAVVAGGAFGAFDPGVYKQRYDSRPELTLALDAPAELHELAQRQSLISRHIDAVRVLANLGANDVTPTALAARA